MAFDLRHINRIADSQGVVVIWGVLDQSIARIAGRTLVDKIA